MLRPIVAALVSTGAIAFQAFAQGGPQFRADGPEAELYGKGRGYPMCSGLAYLNDSGCRVGAFSSFGTLFPSRAIRAAAQASPLNRSAQEPRIHYRYEGASRTLDDYLNARPTTGFLIAKDDTILVERYQYDRTDRHPMTSFSMAKTVVGLLIGIALEQGAIRSIDDVAATYVPELENTEYGRTPIKALLLMSSGVAFSEQYNNPSSDIYTLARLTLEQDPAGSVEAVKRFNTRRAPPGTSYVYSSAESVVLGLVLSRATRRTVADYTSEKLWQPLGAEADASWNVDARGHEVTYAYLNAVLRDWARLGLMLAHGGAWNGRQIVPESWINASTTVQPDWPAPTYGYHVRISHTDRARFYLSGLRGQFVFVDPATRMVLVQTSLAGSDYANMELAELWAAARSQAGR
jgi:CubicO group peptidase (beta-lactamase class C family)